MSDGFTDPEAGRYGGSDPAVMKALREIQRNWQRMRVDPIYKIIGTTSIPGTYAGVSLAGRSTVDGLADPGAHWGMASDPSNRTILLVNTLESQTAAASVVPAGTIVTGSRRPGGATGTGADVVFFNYHPGLTNYASFVDTTVTGVDGGTGDGTGGTDPNNGSGTGTNSGGGGILGGGTGGGTGGGADGSCPLTYSGTVSGFGTPARSFTTTMTWNGSNWSGSGFDSLGDFQSLLLEIPVTLSPSGDTGALLSLGSDTFLYITAATCPPTGGYPYRGANSPTPAGSVS